MMTLAFPARHRADGRGRALSGYTESEQADVSRLDPVGGQVDRDPPPDPAPSLCRNSGCPREPQL